MESLASIVGRVPDSARFPHVDEVPGLLRELHERAEGVATMSVIGQSRQTRPLVMLTVGDGDRHAIVTGLPHPNEPIGSLGALALAELLVGDAALRAELGLVWHIIPCADPDGAALNEGWMQGPYSRRHYAEYVYRSPFDEQYEWTFGRPELGMDGIGWVPESKAVAAVIDELEPVLLISMHNAEAGGLFAYVGVDRPGLDLVVKSVGHATGLEVAAVQPEGTDEVHLGPGLWLMDPEIEGMVGSVGYAHPHKTLGAIVEVPMWREPRIGDDRPGTRSRAAVERECSELRAEAATRMNEWMKVLRDHANLDSAFGRALLSQFGSMTRTAEPSSEVATPASTCAIAEEASRLELVRMERLRGVGHVLGVLREMEGAGPLAQELAAVRSSALESLDEWAPAQDEQEFVGLGASVRAHVGMAIELARAVGATPTTP